MEGSFLRLDISKRRIMSKALLFLGPLALLSGIWLTQQQFFIAVVQQYSVFTLVGIIGAIFANATGAGGGVVFIPVFSGLGLDPQQSTSTSFAIQCFGMATGALSWWHYRTSLSDNCWPQFYKIISVCAPCSIFGLWLCQWQSFQPPQSMLFTFGIFSIVLGTALLFRLKHPLANTKTKIGIITCHDFWLLALISFIGGIITAWLSVGVGELVAIYLLLRKVNPVMSVAIAVIVSALTVWSCAYIHFLPTAKTHFYIVYFAGPGAIIGGLLARKLVLFLPSKKLKAFFAIWIILSGITVLIFES